MREKLVSKAFIEFLDTASTPWAANSCPDCGSRLEYRNCTFFFEGQTWEIPLPLCAKCHPISPVVPPYEA
jgi:hypothetical protein